MNIRVVLTIFAFVGTFAGQAFSADTAEAPAISINKSIPVGSVDEVVARVNGSEITRKDLDAAVQAYNYQMSKQGRPVPPDKMAVQLSVLDELIGRQLILQQGMKQIPPDIDKKVQEQIDQTKKTMIGGEDKFKKALADNEVTLEEYTRKVRDKIIISETIQSLVDKQVGISIEDARAFYDANPDQFKQVKGGKSVTVPFDEVKDTLVDYLKLRKRSEITRTYVADLRNAAKVEVLLYAPASALSRSSVETPPVTATGANTETLTNDSIIQLHKLGLGDSVVIEKIKMSTCQFDTSIDALKILKNAEISDAIIQVMLVTSAHTPAALPVPPAPVVAATPSADMLKPQLKEFIDKSTFYCTDGIGRQVDRILCTPTEINVLGMSLQDKQLIVKVKFKMKPVGTQSGQFRMSDLFDSYDEEETITFQKFDTGWQILTPEPYSDGHLREIRPRKYYGT